MPGNNWNRNGNNKGWQNNNTSNNNRNIPVAQGNQYFVNPYTFIPLGDKAPDRKPQEYGTLSGVINCSIEIRTPTFIPNTTKSFKDSDNEEHKHKVFYSYADLGKENSLTDEIRRPSNPVIPGSEIRGMVRNVYEQLTNSCLIHVDEFNLPYKRTNEPKKRCLLVWNESQKVWKLYKGSEASKERNEFEYYSGSVEYDANNKTYYLNEKGWKGDPDINEDYEKLLSLFNYGKNNKTVFYDNNDIEPYTDGDNYYWIHIPPLMKGKTPAGVPTANKVIVYSSNNLKGGVAVSDKNIGRFEKVLGLVENIKGGYDSDINQNSISQKIYKNYVNHYKNHEPLIVYVDKDSYDKHFRNDVIYMSPASMTKEFFDNTIDKILEKNAHHQPCSKKDDVCPACRLFGMVGIDGATCGKLRFSDGENNGTLEYGKEIVMEILGSPRISSTEFYLQRPTANDGSYADIWNYDYYLKCSGHGKDIKYERTVYDAKLMGRKVYWNKDPKIKADQKTKMNYSVTPLTKGSFNFSIHFEKLTNDELNKLLFCLKLDNNSYHKIGCAKPLGFGQVKLNVESVKTAKYSLENGKIIKTSQDYVYSQADYNNVLGTQVAKNIIKYSSDLPDYLKNIIDYPRPADSSDIFKWFGKNRIVGKPISQVLPKITDAVDRQKLPKTP